MLYGCQCNLTWIQWRSFSFFCPSIHPCIHLLLLIHGRGILAAALAEKLWLPCPQPLHPALLGGMPRHSQDRLPPKCPRSSPGPTPNGTCPEHLTRKASRGNPKQMPRPPHLAPLNAEEQWLESEFFPDDQTSRFISRREPGHPKDPGSCSFSHS